MKNQDKKQKIVKVPLIIKSPVVMIRGKEEAKKWNMVEPAYCHMQVHEHADGGHLFTCVGGCEEGETCTAHMQGWMEQIECRCTNNEDGTKDGRCNLLATKQEGGEYNLECVGGCPEGETCQLVVYEGPVYDKESGETREGRYSYCVCKKPKNKVSESIKEIKKETKMTKCDSC